MNPHRYWLWMMLEFVALLVGVWINPGYMYRVDWFLIVMLFAFIMTTWVYYFYVEGHRGGYATMSYLGHSATMNGKWAFEVPPAGDYPVMVAIPRGGGNYMGFPYRGGGKEGWTIVPKEQVKEMNGNLVAFTRTMQIEPSGLPSHIRKVLEEHELYDPRGMVEFGVWPYYKDLSADIAGMRDFDVLSAQTSANVKNQALESQNDVLLGNIRGYNDAMRSVGTGIREVPKQSMVETIQDKFAGGEQNAR